MKALIIGGAGFVGAYLMRYLKEELHMEVTVTKDAAGADRGRECQSM